jgi:predicted metalloendopeptidase
MCADICRTFLKDKHFLSFPRCYTILTLYVRIHLLIKFDGQSACVQVSEMMHDIKVGFNSLLRDGDWIDPETKKAAKQKAEGITSFIGYQEWLLQPGRLDEHYGSVCLVQYHASWYIRSHHSWN